jgi:hypothetical protein
VVSVAVLATAFWSWRGFRDLSTSTQATEVIRARGEWIRAHTGPHDFVVYVCEGSADNWNPAYLYFARRDGQNLLREDATPVRVAAIAARAYGRYPRVVVFTVWPDVAGSLSEAGAKALATDRHRTLLRVDATRVSAPPAPG